MFIFYNGEVKIQRVVCSKVQVLAGESMLPNKLERHLTSSHPQFVNILGSFFSESN